MCPTTEPRNWCLILSKQSSLQVLRSQSADGVRRVQKSSTFENPPEKVMMNSLAGSIVCTRQLQPFFRRPHVVPRPGAVSRGTWLQHRAASRALRQSTAHVVRAEGQPRQS